MFVWLAAWLSCLQERREWRETTCQLNMFLQIGNNAPAGACAAGKQSEAGADEGVQGDEALHPAAVHHGQHGHLGARLHDLNAIGRECGKQGR